MKLKVLFFFLLLSITSCIKNTSYPTVPVIEYKDFVAYGHDSAHFTFGFKDGDGDIGFFEEGDTMPPFNVASKYYNDLYMIYYFKKDDGKFYVYDDSLATAAIDTFMFPYRIRPNLTPIGQNKALDGTITVRLPVPYWKVRKSPPHKIIKFDAFIYDRALHKSNIISTPEIVISK